MKKLFSIIIANLLLLLSLPLTIMAENSTNSFWHAVHHNFKLKVAPEGDSEPITAGFNQQFYVD